ncbi:DUF5959 family protein [Streptomyces sp. NPDC058157]|uniref:DUF5959 family protein n=1 Tax=Streptomyces sp. NPDC058157 TaxID=3346360 RepID=UPI0036E6591B
MHFTDADLADLTAFMAARAAAEEDGAPPDGSVTDWPAAGRSAYLRLRAADPFVVEVRDPVQSGVTVTVPLNLPDGWATRAASRLARLGTTLTSGRYPGTPAGGRATTPGRPEHRNAASPPLHPVLPVLPVFPVHPVLHGRTVGSWRPATTW